MSMYFHDNSAIHTASGLGQNAGDILQTTSISVLSSNYTTSNTSVQDIGLTCSITPSASSSKIIVHAVLCVEGYGDRDRRPITSIHNGSVGTLSNQLARLFAGEYHTGDSGSYSYGGHTYWYLDSPNTSSSITYRVGLKSGDGHNVRVRGGTGTDKQSYMFLQEVKG